MAQRPTSRPPAGGWSGLSKNLALWVMVALMATFLWQVMSKQRSATTDACPSMIWIALAGQSRTHV